MFIGVAMDPIGPPLADLLESGTRRASVELRALQ
jgi:hypothetical protein